MSLVTSLLILPPNTTALLYDIFVIVSVFRGGGFWPVLSGFTHLPESGNNKKDSCDITIFFQQSARYYINFAMNHYYQNYSCNYYVCTSVIQHQEYNGWHA